jgi:hypothetical protein
MENTRENWVYEYDGKYPKYEVRYKISKVRYILGQIFNPDKKERKTLICIGINPSTAVPGHLDQTLIRVQRYAEKKKYDAWYMLNVYPQRATNPADIHKEEKWDREIHRRNIKAIKKLLTTIKEADVWCAWGGLITKRKYLNDLFFGKEEKKGGIIDLFNDSYTFKAYGTTKKGYPRHPLKMSKEAKLEDYRCQRI